MLISVFFGWGLSSLFLLSSPDLGKVVTMAFLVGSASESLSGVASVGPI